MPYEEMMIAILPYEEGVASEMFLEGSGRFWKVLEARGPIGKMSLLRGKGV